MFPTLFGEVCHVVLEENFMKPEPEIVKILREEESHNFQSYYIQQVEKKSFSSNGGKHNLSSSPASKRKIAHRISLSKKILITSLKMLVSDQVFDGENIAKFEHKFREYLGINYAISTSSGRMALYLILRSLKLKEGSEILLPAYMLPALPQVSLYCGLKPIFVDIDPCTLNIDPDDIEKKITSHSKVILAVHLYGHPCPMDKIEQLAKKYNLIIIEDCAQAIGAMYDGKKLGTFGKASYFSFGCAKELNTYGGGMIATDDVAIYKDVQEKLRQFSWPKKSLLVKRFLHNIFNWLSGLPPIFDYITYPLLRVAYVFDKEFVFNKTKSNDILKLSNVSENEFLEKYRFLYTNFQATIALEQFRNVERHLSIKNNNASFLNEQLQRHAPMRNNSRCSFYRYCIKTDSPQVLLHELFRAGIVTTDGSYVVLPDLDMFRDYRTPCPNARNISTQLIYLPVQPHLKRGDMVKMAQVLHTYLSSIKHNQDTFPLKENVKHQLSHSISK